MAFSKRFNKFLKSEQFKMICCIFLVLLASIMIKLSMPSTFEHLNYSFKLKFKKTPGPSTDPKITEFDFEINNKTGEVRDGNPAEISFSDMPEPSGNINLIVSGNTEKAKDLMQNLKIADVSGTPGTESDQDKYTFNISEEKYKNDQEITMTTE